MVPEGCQCDQIYMMKATEAGIVRLLHDACQAEVALTNFVVLVVDGDAFTAVLAPCT